jgi:hypothetical protein
MAPGVPFTAGGLMPSRKPFLAQKHPYAVAPTLTKKPAHTLRSGTNSRCVFGVVLTKHFQSPRQVVHFEQLFCRKG